MPSKILRSRLKRAWLATKSKTNLSQIKRAPNLVKRTVKIQIKMISKGWMLSQVRCQKMHKWLMHLNQMAKIRVRTVSKVTK